MTKLDFFKNEYVPKLRLLKGDEKGQWGVLSAQGMVEHMTDSIALAHRILAPLQTPEAVLPKAKAFAMSDKEFKPGTPNSLMSAEAAPLRNAGMNEAIDEIEKEIDDFINWFGNHPGQSNRNPFFGELNFDEWLHLLHKHATHHLKQFGIN